MKRLFAIRGATGSKNIKDSIIENTTQMCREIFLKNNLSCARDIVSITFSMTEDLRAFNPCTALRVSDLGLDTKDVALFCTQEAAVEGAPSSIIRVIVYAYLDEGAKITPIYINGAQRLRPDLIIDR